MRFFKFGYFWLVSELISSGDEIINLEQADPDLLRPDPDLLRPDPV